MCSPAFRFASLFASFRSDLFLSETMEDEGSHIRVTRRVYCSACLDWRWVVGFCVDLGRSHGGRGFVRLKLEEAVSEGLNRQVNKACMACKRIWK